MSSIPQHLLHAHAPEPRTAALSDRLLDPLHLVTSRARLLAILKALFQFLVTAATTWLVLILVLGSFRNLPVAVAVLLTVVAWVVMLGSLLFFFRPAFRRRDLSTAARMVDASLPDAHERVSSAIELTEETDHRFTGSQELIAALVRQAEHTAESLDPALVVSGRTVFRWFLSLIPLFLVWFILLVVLTPTVSLGFQRILQPWKAAAALPKATLDVDPQNITIAQGESVTINLAVTPVASAAVAPDKPVESASIIRRYAAGGANEDITSAMERTGNRTFRSIFDNVQQTFSYRLTSEGADSPTYTVTVQPRPAVNSVQVDYAYPAYTRRAAHTDTTRNGAIDAVVGTRVTVTIESSQPLKSANLSITDNTPDPSTLPLTPAPPHAQNPTHFTTQFTLRKSTDYRLHLINPQDLDNADKQPRPIIARLDTPPQISITSPTDGALKVRPDDSVSIKYLASDDFGLTRIELLTQVDDQSPSVTLLPLAPDQTNVTGSTALSVHDLLNLLPANPAPKRIAYQFRAADNRAPEPQTGLSIKQVLLIDRNIAPLAARQDEQAARTLGDAVRQAGADLDDAKAKLDTLRQTAATRPLTETEKQQAADARRDLANAAQILQSAADKSSDSRLAHSAKQAREIADQPIRQAQENTAASQLASDQPDARNKSLDAASQNIAEAKQKLDALARDVGEKAKDQPLAHELERIAAEQRRLADALAQNPNDPKLLAQQRQLQQDLEKLIKDHPELQKPAADAAQAKADDLSKKLQDLQQAQQPLNDNAKNQTDAAHVQDKLNDLAKQQDDLNQKVQKFNEQQSDALKRSGVKTPDSSQFSPIVKDLQAKNLANAGQAQNAAASQLDDAAKQLENADKHPNEPGAPSSPAQTAKDATALQDQAKDLQKQIDDAQKNHNPPTRPSDPANQEATRLADQVHRQAQQLSHSPANRQAAKQATDEADAAKRDAAAGNASSAQQHLAAATAALADAAKSNKDPATPGASPPNSAAAAEQARDLAQQQRALADQTRQTDKSLDSAAAARNNSPQSADQQRKLADQMEQAAQSAKNLEQQTKGAAPDLSQRAGQSAQALQKAADAQRAAAQATQSGNSSQAAAQQQQSAQSLASAQQSMSPSSSSSPSAPSGGNKSGGSPSSSGSPSSPSPGGSASAQRGGNAPGQPGAADDSAAQAVQAARNAQSQAASGNPAAARQAADQLSQASQQLLSGNGKPAAGGSAAAPSNNGSGQSPAGRPGAAGTPTPTASAQSAQGGAAGGATGGGGRPNASGSPNSIGAPSRGVASSAATPLPKSVQEIGVSPSDWARLPPNTQQQLLNSAQQSGPPAYRDMIKNYYSRIAHIDDAGAAQ